MGRLLKMQAHAVDVYKVDYTGQTNIFVDDDYRWFISDVLGVTGPAQRDLGTASDHPSALRTVIGDVRRFIGDTAAEEVAMAMMVRLGFEASP